MDAHQLGDAGFSLTQADAGYGGLSCPIPTFPMPCAGGYGYNGYLFEIAPTNHPLPTGAKVDCVQVLCCIHSLKLY